MRLHHGSEQHLRSAEEIATMVHTCNARRANYLLDVPPDRTGRIPEAFVKRFDVPEQLRNFLFGLAPGRVFTNS